MATRKGRPRLDWQVVALVALPVLAMAAFEWIRMRFGKEREALRRVLEDAKERAVRAESRAMDAEALREERSRLDRFQHGLEERERDLEARRAEFERERRAVGTERELLERDRAEIADKVAEVAAMTVEEARERYLAQIEPALRSSVDRRARELEADASRRSRSVLLTAIERASVATVAEATVTVVSLPSEDLKGRLIGREGRNVRAFEQATGVDLLIDETPDSVVLSCFDPIRRETARLTLARLISEGRIHPARIEEAYREAEEEVGRTIAEAGHRSAERAGVAGLDAPIVQALGRLRFRTSVGQNVLDHVVECARLAGDLAAEIRSDPVLARRAALLHDIGKGLGSEWEGPHALGGARFLVAHGESDEVGHAVAAHHHDVEPASETAVLVIVADTLSAARPGARRDNLEQHVRRLTQLEDLARSFEGVERAIALEAGRDLRLIVHPELVDDAGVRRLADAVAARIEETLEYPGQIKVTVIRETRAWKVAQ
ncbi:MAG: ribonuclease Y [Fimbriimonadaceae bacterium]|nr:ribonuclease Y [Fimbriimonadaceae bacterium]